MAEDRIIAIETSGRCGSVAVAVGPRLLAERDFATQVEHARELLPAIDGLCREMGWSPASLKQCHLSNGPGSFTGLRVAVTFARHLALAAGVRICAVPTLDVIAENCAAMRPPPPRLAVFLDAQRDRVYAAVFELGEGVYRRTIDPHLAEPGQLLAAGPQPIAVAGEGIEHHLAVIAASGAQVLDRELWWPRAANVHRLGWRLAEQGRFTPARELVPHYVRRPEAEEVWEKRQAAQGAAQE